MSKEKILSTVNQLSSLTIENRFKLLAKKATQAGYSFAIYRMPEGSEVKFVAGRKLHQIDHEDLSNLGTGFLISNFIGEHFYFDQDILYSSTGDTENIDLILEDNPEVDVIWQPYIVENPVEATKMDSFVTRVSDCIQEIKASELIKVVPSRTKIIDLDTDKLAEIFVNLCDAYPTAFISIISTPELGTWIGATPETLIEVDKEGFFTTMSLAGTQKYNEEPLHTLPWTQKEIEEQAMVSRYIINRFKEIRLREFVEKGPRTVSAGNMAHLCTTFTVDTKATNFPNLGSIMLKLLHPTSAVCGMPKQQAQDLLSRTEAHDRKLYSGYLGPVNMNEGSYIYVNLRCMEIQNNKAILYAGAGVTEYSDPEQEWYETELKCNTLLNVIGK